LRNLNVPCGKKNLSGFRRSRITDTFGVFINTKETNKTKFSDDSIAALCETLTSLAVKKNYQASGESG
jgi:hypothetical protein